MDDSEDRIGVSIGKVPQKFKVELDAIMTNIKAIHNDAVAAHIRFLINFDALVGVILGMTSPREGLSINALKEVICTVSAQLITSHSDALNLDENEIRVAVKTAETVRHVVEQLENEINKKGN